MNQEFVKNTILFLEDACNKVIKRLHVHRRLIIPVRDKINMISITAGFVRSMYLLSVRLSCLTSEYMQNQGVTV